MAFENSRLQVGVIGFGRAGGALAIALARAGHQIVAIHSVSEQSKRRASRLFPAATITSAQQVATKSQLLLLAVPDDQLTNLVRGLAAENCFSEGQFVLHSSGRFGLLPLLPAVDAGAVAMAVHPAMTLTGDDTDAQRLNNCPFAITSAIQHRPIAQALVIEMGGEPVWVDDADRVRYHAALTHAANHLQTLIAQSGNELAAIGIDKPEKFLAPLTTAALENVLTGGFESLTGPIRRGDVATVEAHLAEMSADIKPSYVALALATVDLLDRKAELKPDVVHKFREVLEL